VLGPDHPDTRRSAARLDISDDDEEDWDDEQELQPEEMSHG
jgi:hypothetical protein